MVVTAVGINSQTGIIMQLMSDGEQAKDKKNKKKKKDGKIAQKQTNSNPQIFKFRNFQTRNL